MTSQEKDRTKERRAQTPENFPCHKERNQSMMCLHDNNYDYSKCQMAFDNFKFCKQFWELVSKKRKAANIVPNLPEAEEREIIMDHFKKTGTLPPQSS
ncbi:coiled-coil-helix-coiled-coil-helix domain-containing protein 7 [Frankliniella occidentalis]|uniref:Coiled-coil-helix-coiled-coil-helix domain-containing protein 7 n=1 Tax=Frankliniella occidentalis TaxID=133901 RepID=A0A6J1SNH7_FRAOC|nr:coiled-coil-helix-coiled-coil-helix domain-containing protein 7 [Frankliniella occidentalis]